MVGSSSPSNGSIAESTKLPYLNSHADKSNVGKPPSKQKSAPSGRSQSSSGAEIGQEQVYSVDANTGATIFQRRDRPTFIPAQSFVVGGGKSTPRASSYDNRLSWKNLPHFPTFNSIPSMPAMPELPSIPFFKTRDSAPKQDFIPKVDSQSSPEEVRAAETNIPATSDPDEAYAKGIPLKQKLVDLHAKHPNLRDTSKPLLPIAVFPNQGTGKSSEFNQEAPIWARQPFKLLYFAYFGLSVGLIFLPWFAISSLFASQRPRSTWDWKRSTLVKLFRHGARLTFRTYTSLSRDLTKEVPHSKTVRGKFVWVDGLPDELVKGQVRAAMKLQDLRPTRTCGFWYGERDGGGGVGQRASAGEKVIYHLHGGAYWIGTAHEKDITSAVNMQVLRALDAIYDSRLPKPQSQEQVWESNIEEPPNFSPHPTNGIPAAKKETTSQGHTSGGLCKRAFSLDYRLCVPGHPEMGSYPAALLDSLAGYRYLVQECGFACENIIVAGDSAGGNLALAMCRYLRDENLYGMPGAMLLLSPWSDASRSHSGPPNNPNLFSTTYTNRDSDIISPSMAFRNTAVSALLGRLAAGETYRNPYISSISLQLPTDKGGSGPNWGFEGFPRRIYICTGSAELSHDQHLTLAYRLAGGTKIGRPIHSGDQLSVNADAFEMAARLSYARPKDCEITLWPSAQNVPAGTPLWPPTEWGGLCDGESKVGSHTEEGMNNLSHRLKTANGYPSQNGIAYSSTFGDAIANTNNQQTGIPYQQKDKLRHIQSIAPSTDAAAAVDTEYEAGKGPNMSQVKEKDTEVSADVTHEHGHENTTDEEKKAAINGHANMVDSSSSRRAKKSNSASLASMKMGDIVEDPPIDNDGSQIMIEPSYFDLEREDRTVILDECKDGVHDYTLFNWYEPERGQTWARIAKWIDEEV